MQSDAQFRCDFIFYCSAGSTHKHTYTHMCQICIKYSRSKCKYNTYKKLVSR